MSDRRKAIVIGSGFGGLAAAVRLDARGYRVTVLENPDDLGGRVYVFRQDDCTFDAGPTIIAGRFFLDQLRALCGRKVEDAVELHDMNPFYRIRFNDGETFDCSPESVAMWREIARFSP